MEFDIQGVLFPNWLTMLVQFCSTIVLFLLCKKLLWTPARNILKTRQEKMNEGLENARKLQEEATADLNDAKENLEKARERSSEIVEQARKEANELRDEIVNHAKDEANQKLANADKQIENKKLEAKQEIHDEMVNVAMAAVSKLLNDKATSKDDEEAIQKYIDEVNKNS